MLAARPKTLPAAAAPVIAGTAVALREGVFSPGPALAALLGALLIQIGTNFANDVFDYKKGADTSERLGPLRVTQAGLLKPKQVFTGMWITFGLAVVVGIYLLAVAGWPVVWIGLFSILAGIAYTGGPFPLGYNGLGDIFVFIFFGLVAVCGTYFVQAAAVVPPGIVSAGAVWAAIPIGFLATAILVVNNLRDIETDMKAGKKTLVVRFGATAARIEYDVMVGGAYLCPLLMWLTGNASPWVLLTWLTLYRAIPLIKLIYTEKGRALNKGLAGTGRMELEFAILLALGLVIESLF
jgi:1,4-dihydroxy-2-naphthoate octaprenyltransferase